MSVLIRTGTHSPPLDHQNHFTQHFISRTDIVYPDGRPYFKNYMDSVWDLYVLVTTSNNPDVM